MERTRPVGERVDDGTGPAELPTATLRSSEASDRSTRWVMRFTFFMLAVLLLMCVIGPHIPSGE